MIELKGVSKTYGSQTVVAPVDWALESGRTHVLIGPSGCGKSTILRMMIGLVHPSTGEVCFDGKPVRKEDWPDIRLIMGYVIQDGGLFPHLTAEGNILLMATQKRWPRDRMKHRLQDLLALTHFPEDALKRYPAQLSGGQRQRVALMRALMLDPKVILLDEPLGALDPMSRNNLQSELREVFQKLEKTVVLVTHDVGEARYLGDEILLLRRGRVIQKGPFENLVESPATDFVKEFLSAQRSIDDVELTT